MIYAAVFIIYLNFFMQEVATMLWEQFINDVNEKTLSHFFETLSQDQEQPVIDKTFMSSKGKDKVT